MLVVFGFKEFDVFVVERVIWVVLEMFKLV